MAVSEEVGVSAERLERIRPVMQDYVDKGKPPRIPDCRSQTRKNRPF